MCSLCRILYSSELERLWHYFDGEHWYFGLTGGSLCGKACR